MKNLLIPNKNNHYRPFFLKTGFLSVIVLFTIIGNILFSAFGMLKISAYIDFDSIYTLHNTERLNNSLKELQVNQLLINSATNKAEAMLASDCWSHYCPDGKSPWDFFKASGYEYIYAGENLGEGFNSNDALMSAWMNSPTHRSNILNGEFDEIGIGFAKGDFQGIKDNIIVVVHFGKSDSNQANTIKETNNSKTKNDNTSPTINYDDFSIKEIKNTEKDRYLISFYNSDVENFSISNNLSSTKMSPNNWQISISKEQVIQLSSITVTVSDSAGNKSDFELPLNMLIKKSEAVNVSEVDNQENIFSDIYKDFSQNPKNQLNFSVMVFLTGLFGIDYYILEKSGKTSLNRNNRHIFVILIIICLFLLIVTSAGGKILDGVTF